MNNIAILLSGGTGSRIGGIIPKQYIEVNEKPIVEYSIEKIISSNMFFHIQVVASSEYRLLLEKIVDNRISIAFSKPGDNRQLSVYNALLDIEEFVKEDTRVLIHDAARPNLSEKMIFECLNSLDTHEGVIPVLPMKDTVYECDDEGKIVSLLPRANVFAGQSPEAFVYGKYLEANRKLTRAEMLKIHGSTEPAIKAGMDVFSIKGDEKNYKITTILDLEKFMKEME